MPKAGDVTFSIEPVAVLEAVGWLMAYEPNTAHASALLVTLTPEREVERAVAWNGKVMDATLPLLRWLKRGGGKRLSREERLVPAPLCIDRQILEWLAKFAPTAGGLIGGVRKRVPKSPKTDAAAHFFAACREAATRRVGRPKISRTKAAQRLVHQSSQLPPTTLWRMAKIAGDREPDIQKLLKAYAAKNSLISETDSP